MGKKVNLTMTLEVKPGEHEDSVIGEYSFLVGEKLE